MMKKNNTRNTVIGATAGASVAFQYTKLDSVDQLNDRSRLIGANTPIGGFETVNDFYTNEYQGFSISLGIGPAADFHFNETNTITLIKFKSPIKVFIEWLEG